MRLFSIIILFSLSTLLSCQQSSTDDTSDSSFPELTDNELLTTIQKQTFKYFWEGAEPTSGLARERFHVDGVYPQNDKNIITIGGSGFGLMSIIVGMERGFISKNEGAARIDKAVDFLGKAERFHGAWSHWYEGSTGKVKAFSEQDNGADIVETAFMAQALIAVREYYKNGDDREKAIAARANQLWEEIDWDFFRNGQDVLYWHWSPSHGWGMNHAIQGYDECLIAYILAASSPTHPIPSSTYHKGWARNGQIKTDLSHYDIPMVLKHNSPNNQIGPLFWAHYSYLGLDPNGLHDQYADYWKLNVNHVKINIAYAEQNPENYKGYGKDEGWGLSASYSVNGYNAHHPGNDSGVISPTAALSSMPYTPDESLHFARYLLNKHPQMWGDYGFYDAYSESDNWYPEKYLAIDQGPIVVMIENHRTSLLWDLFMNAPEVQNGLKILGFSSPYLTD